MGNRILLADDSITIQKVVNLTFADEGIEVVSVSNGDMAERRLNEVNPDLVLADIFMPGKNGYELCESIKQSAQFGNVPVVLLVGAFEPFDQAEARRVRADAHLTKPFESRTLVETVRKLINTSGHARTGSLSTAQPAEQTGARQTQGQASAPFVQPSPGTDSSATKNEAAPPAPQRAESPAHSADDLESLQALEVQFTPEPYREQPDRSSALPWMEQTEELTDVSATRERPSDPFDLSPLEASAQGPDESALTAGLRAIDAPDLAPDMENVELDLESLESGLPSGFSIEDEEMILDLDRPEAVYTHESEHAPPLDHGSNGSFSFDSRGSQGETIQASSWTDSDVFKTQMLEPPEGLAQARMEERIDTNPLEMPAVSDFNRSSAAPAGFAEMREAESSSSTLLAVDDPLGDVLMDGQELDVLSYDPHQSSQILFAEQPAIEEFNLEFNPQEQEVFAVPEQSSTAARTTGGLIESAPPISEAQTFSTDVAEQKGEPYEEAAVEAQPQLGEAQPQLADEPVEARPAFEAFTGEAIEQTESGAKADWSETGFEFNSEFQDATPERSSDQGEYTFDASRESLNADRAPVAEFTTSAMWNEEEARFAPIDIEATPVDEPAAATVVSGHDAMETGFEIAPATDEGPSYLDDATVAEAQVTEAQVAEASPAAESLPAAAAPETADVPQALIDEIVRRVVSQMSESVVREIAWEVVPDVVERVIKEMARDEVSKHV